VIADLTFQRDLGLLLSVIVVNGEGGSHKLVEVRASPLLSSKRPNPPLLDSLVTMLPPSSQRRVGIAELAPSFLFLPDCHLVEVVIQGIVHGAVGDPPTCV